MDQLDFWTTKAKVWTVYKLVGVRALCMKIDKWWINKSDLLFGNALYINAWQQRTDCIKYYVLLNNTLKLNKSLSLCSICLGFLELLLRLFWNLVQDRTNLIPKIKKSPFSPSNFNSWKRKWNNYFWRIMFLLFICFPRWIITEHK